MVYLIICQSVHKFFPRVKKKKRKASLHFSSELLCDSVGRSLISYLSLIGLYSACIERCLVRTAYKRTFYARDTHTNNVCTCTGFEECRSCPHIFHLDTFPGGNMFETKVAPLQETSIMCTHKRKCRFFSILHKISFNLAVFICGIV